jgi:acyl carrier protein
VDSTGCRLGSVVHIADPGAASPAEFEREVALALALDRAADDVSPRVFVLVHDAADLFESACTRQRAIHHGLQRGLRSWSESICRRRRARGQAAVTIAIARPGGAPAPGEKQRLKAVLASLGTAPFEQAGVVIPVTPDDWPADAIAPHGLLQHRLRTALSESSDRATQAPISLSGLSPEERATRLRGVVEDRVASVLALSAEARARLDADAPLVDLGIDSLMASELTLGLESDVGLALPPAIWATRPSLHELLAELSAGLEQMEENA